MKNIIAYLLILVSLLILNGCSTTNKTSKESNANRSNTQKQENSQKRTSDVNYTSLADYIRNNSNVRVSGVEPNVQLLIRGINSVSSDTRPFIYVDRNPIGRDYVRANNAVNPNNIKRVEVISNLADLTRYGQEGHSGIIKIHTKTNLSK